MTQNEQPSVLLGAEIPESTQSLSATYDEDFDDDWDDDDDDDDD